MNMVRKKDKPHRSRYEIVNEILRVVMIGNQSPSSFYICKLLHIEYGARLTYRQTLDYLPALVESRLLIKRKTTKLGPFPHYEITDSGRRYLQLFADIEDDLRPAEDADLTRFFHAAGFATYK
jgi:predicted transcriptional regulator